MIACKRVTKNVGSKSILGDVTMRVEPKECVCITGAAGSGKTTLFNLLLGEETATSGSIEIDGVALKDLPPLILQLYRSRVGVIFQEPQLIEHLTVAENVMFPLELQGIADAVARKRALEILKKLGVAAKATSRPPKLSQSERALAGIARAFAGNPMIILADEPLQLLDEAQAELALGLFRGAQAQGVTVIALTSNPAVAEALGGRTLTLENGKIAEPAASRAVARAMDPHRILETDDIPLSEFTAAAPAPESPAPKAAKSKGGKGGKIKITAIGM